MKTLFFILLALTVKAFAGDKGNGGYSVVCRDSGDKIVTAELLDIYEGRVLYKKTYAVDLKSVAELTEEARHKLSEYGIFSHKLVREYSLIERNTIFIPAGNDLELTDDAFPVIRKRGCKFEQLANYTENGELYVSQEIYDSLDNLNKAALFLHEAVYSMRRKALGETTSQNTRKLVAQVMAQNPDISVIERFISDTFGPKNRRACGLRGSIEDKIESCSYVTRSNWNLQLVTRTIEGREVWFDPTKNLLWSDRISSRMNFENALRACDAQLPEMGNLSYRWRLPTEEDYSYGQALSQTLPNMMGWFWTSSQKGKLVKIYNAETAEIGTTPFRNTQGSVRCAASVLQ